MNNISTWALIALCVTQAYTWWEFTKFKAIASINLVGMNISYADKMLEMSKEIDKLKEQLKKYEDRQKSEAPEVQH